ncbi:hypothetical protein D9M72_520550 [compost metagenome]
MRGDGRAVGWHVDGDHLDAGLLGLFDCGAHALAIDRRDDDHVDALDDEILDVGELLVEVLVGDRNFERDVLLFRLGFHRVGKLDVERVLLGQKRGADAFGRCGRCNQGQCGAGDKRLENTGHVHGFPPWKRRGPLVLAAKQEGPPITVLAMT